MAKNEISPQITLEPVRSLSLEDWAKRVITSGEPQEEPFPTVNLGRFGLKTPKDVVTFLRSPAGHSILAEIDAELANEKILHDYQQMQRLEHALLLRRLHAALFLWFLEEEADAAEKVKEIVLEQQKKILGIGKTLEPTPASTKEVKEHLSKTIADYEQALLANNKLLEQVSATTEALGRQAKKLAFEGDLIDYKYDLYSVELEDFDHILAKFEKLGQNMSDAEIESAIEQIREKCDKILLQIDELIKNNQDEEASLVMKSHTALNLKLASHYDMLAVRNGTKYYANEEGVEVDSFEKAHYILNTDKVLSSKEPSNYQKIVKEGDTLYLLGPGQQWDTIKNDQTAKDKARKNFEDKKHDILVVKKVLDLNKGLEKEVHGKQVEEVEIKTLNSEAQKNLLQNQDRLLQSALASAQNLLKNPNLGLSVPTPTVTGSSSIPKPQPMAQALAFKNKLTELKLKPNVTIDDIKTLTVMTQLGSPQKIYLEQAITILSQSGGPIPYVTAQFLLKNLEQFGIDTTKPNVTSLKNPLEVVMKTTKQQDIRHDNQETNKEEEEKKTTFNPSPFPTSRF